MSYGSDEGVSHRDGDLRLAARLAAREEASWRELLRRTRRRVRTICHHVGVDEASCIDVEQAVWLAVLRSIDRYSGDGRLESWVDRIAVRTAQRIRDRDRRAHVVEASPEPHVPADPRLRLAVREHLRNLPPRNREALWLHFVEGWSVPEAGERVGVSPNTVKSRMRLALERLRAE